MNQDELFFSLLDPFSALVCLWSLDHQGLGAVPDMS